MRILIGLFILVFLKVCWAEEAKQRDTPVHPLAQALIDNGAVACVARANQLAHYLSNGKNTLVLQKPNQEPDKSLLMATLIQEGTHSTEFATVSLAPNQAIGCGGSYQTVAYAEQSCSSALSQRYPKMKSQSITESGVLFTPLSRSARVLAMTAGKGCILIKQEIVE